MNGAPYILPTNPVQFDEQVGLNRLHQREIRDLLGFGDVADPVKNVSQPANQPVVLRRAHLTAHDCLPEQLSRDLGGAPD